jgi:FecR protein
MPSSLCSRSAASGVLVLLAAVLCASQAAANVGRVDFVIGDVTAVSASGQRRALSRGEELSSGDTIVTHNGRAQIRFADGAYVSLQPNTEFGIKDYRYEGKTDGSERGFFSLLKGGLRAVTGLIGRFNRETFHIVTPTATVGIRGTGGLIQVLNDKSTLINGSSGIWTLTSPAGSIVVPAGTSGIAPADPTIPPHETYEGPSLPPPPPTGGLMNEFRQGDQVNPDGTPSSLSAATVTTRQIPPLQSGSGYAAAVAYGDGVSGFVSSGSGATANFDAAGRLTYANFVDQTSYAVSVFNLQPDGSHAEFGTDGILAWGRWTGGVNLVSGCRTPPCPVTYGPTQGLHYVVGLPTPTLPTSGSASYALLGATRPTYVDSGGTAPGTFSGKLDVTFLATGATVGMNLNVSMPDGKGYAIGGTAITGSGSSLFSGSTSKSLTIAATSDVACTLSCSANVQGFFAGGSAQRVGLGYSISDFESTVVGAAAFKKQ